MKKILTFGIIIVSCQNSKRLDEIWPLEVGNHWSYVVYDQFWHSDSVTTTNTNDTYDITVLGKRSIVYHDTVIEVYLLSRSSKFRDKKEYRDQPLLVRNDDVGLCAYGFQTPHGDSLIEKRLCVKFPSSINETWQSNYLHPGGPWRKRYVETIDTAAEYETSFGKFKAYAYEERTYDEHSAQNDSNPFSSTFTYYKNGLGCIGVVSKYHNRVTGFLKLSSYQLKDRN